MKKRDGIILLEAVVSVFLCVLLTFYYKNSLIASADKIIRCNDKRRMQKEIQKLLSDEKGGRKNMFPAFLNLQSADGKMKL